jgi:hypothetical protein
VSDNITDFLIDPSRIQPRVSSDTRALLSQMLEFNDPILPPVPITSAVPAHTSHSSSQVAVTLPSLIALLARVLEELEGNLSKLLSLNPSRRESILNHLEKLSGTQSPAHGPRTLQEWMMRARSSAQSSALKTYLEEVALIALGQAILLKSWSDRGIRKWSEADLGQLNWALSTALKPHIPLDREGWQITRPNLYSWYSPSRPLQHEIWNTIGSWKINHEGPHYLLKVLMPTRRAQPEHCEPAGYDYRFFQVLWEQMSTVGFNPSPETGLIKRNKVAFSPTLRDGTIVRSAPPSLNWVGLEASSFQLMLSELMQIWWGPTAPPYWSTGTGLEVHTRDQLALALGASKASVISKIAEMEAFDAAFVLEEQVIRSQGRNASSTRFRELLEQLPYFKKIRSSGTSLGDLQACVSLSKLRPGAFLWWAREEALSSKDGNEVLHFILDRAKLCCEWDFSELEHSLPFSVPLYPKHLYLFQKEIHVETRLSHRPVRHSVSGQMRSHVELPLVLEDLFQSAYRQVQPRGQWTLLSHPSPTSQREWVEKWPDPTSQSTLRDMNQLRMASLPLARLTTIRPTPTPDSGKESIPQGQWSIHPSLRGFWLSGGYDAEGRKLITHPLPRPGQESQGSGFLVLVSDEAWISPLIAFLTSDLTKNWLDHNAERKGDRWILNEQVLKWIPIPKSLLAVLGVTTGEETGSVHSGQFALPLPDDWEHWASEVGHNPREVQRALAQVEKNEQGIHIHAAIFVRSSRALDYLSSGQNRLFSLVTQEGKIKWGELLDILPKS